MQRGPKARRLRVDRALHRALRLLVRRRKEAYAVVVRARIVLMASGGLGTRAIARSLGIDERTVRKWKRRFGDDACIAVLRDLPRSGRPSQISVATRCQLVQLECDRPDNTDKPPPFRDVWSYASLAEALFSISGVRLSVSEVGRILRFEGLRPHRVRQWLKSSDPDFISKAERICDLYLSPPKDAVVLCIDEKPLQALERKHATHVDPRDGSVRYEFEYKRHGTQALLAAFNVRTGHVLAKVVPHRTADALVDFMTAVARHYRGRQIYVVWDNLNTHHDGPDKRWTVFNAHHRARFHFIYTPKHASWMNQVEIWFSILQRRVIQRGSFNDKAAQKSRVEGVCCAVEPLRAASFSLDMAYRQATGSPCANVM